MATENKSENMTGISSPKPSLKEEPKIGEQSIISPKTEKCGWGQIVLSAKIKTRKIGMANIKISYSRKMSPQPKVQKPQARCPLNLQKPNQEAPIDKFPSQTKIHQQWEAEMERLNAKYNLDLSLIFSPKQNNIYCC